MSRLLQLLDSRIEVVNYNNDFLILKSVDHSGMRKVGTAIFNKNFSFIEEVIVTEVEICLKLNSGFHPSKIGILETIDQVKQVDPKTYLLPVFFADHEDWFSVEAYVGLGKEEVIAALKRIEFSIAMLGFLPGFLYLDGLEKAFHVPRKTIPSKYVRANSVAIGGQYLGVYSLDSPGGWHVIGQTPVSLLQIPELPPLSLNLEDRIIIQPIEEKKYKDLLKENQNSLEEYNG